MKKNSLFAFVLAASLCLHGGKLWAQLFFDQHYISGTEGIMAGSLPAPGLYLDDVNIYGRSHDAGTGYLGNYEHSITTYINEPRMRWISGQTLLGASFGLELMIPLIYQYQSDVLLAPNRLRFSQTEVGDLEVSPALLSWHLKHFDITAGYAFWMPTGDNSYAGVGDGFVALPPQIHWWAQMIKFGGTWYPDADKKWSVSSLIYYQFNDKFSTTIYSMPQGSIQYGQMFTTVWGISRKLGKYFELGFIGHYSQKTTATYDSSEFYSSASNYNAEIEVGPEIKATVPQYDFSFSIRYLRELNNPDNLGAYNLNLFVLSLSKRF